MAAWWRIISEYLPPWARLAVLWAVPVGVGLNELCRMFHPNVDYGSVDLWGWPILGLFVTFPCAFVSRFISRTIFKHRSLYEAAEEYIRIIRMAMVEAKLSKMEQQFQWRAVMAKLASEIQVGNKPPAIETLDLEPAVQAQIKRLPGATS
jgi:hypothetical protein